MLYQCFSEREEMVPFLLIKLFRKKLSLSRDQWYHTPQFSLEDLVAIIVQLHFSGKRPGRQADKLRSHRCGNSRFLLGSHLAQKHSKQLITDSWSIHPDIRRSQLV